MTEVNRSEIAIVGGCGHVGLPRATAFALQGMPGWPTTSTSTPLKSHVGGAPDLHLLEQVLEESDPLIVGASHRVYAEIQTDKPVVDIWNLRKQRVLL